MSEPTTEATTPGVVITLRLPLAIGAVARLMVAVCDEWPDARMLNNREDTRVVTIVACADAAITVPTPIVACPTPGYTLVRTDELEAAITAYLANDDKGLRGAMADLSATREGTSDESWAALGRAAKNVSDRRTLADDGYWVSRKEMRALDLALGRPDIGTALSDSKNTAAHSARLLRWIVDRLGHRWPDELPPPVHYLLPGGYCEECGGGCLIGFGNR